MPFRTTLLFATLLIVNLACAPKSISVPDTSDVPIGPVVVSTGANENLHAVLWTQTAVEYRAVALQTYAAARAALPAALADTSWTASPDQQARRGYGPLPPAVVLDVDETVLDNSAYQARLIRDDAEYERETWKAWVEEAAATPVPGALAFTRAADSLGITVIYLTNRRGSEETATRTNLAALGFPVSADFDAVLTRDDLTRTGAPEFESGDKGPRRAAVTERFRVLAYLGDSLADFISEADGTEAERDDAAAPYAGWWGERWFMLPNPQYGSWESVLFGNDYSLTREERLRRKTGQLRTGQE